MNPLHLLSQQLPGALGYVVGRDKYGTYAQRLNEEISKAPALFRPLAVSEAVETVATEILRGEE